MIKKYFKSGEFLVITLSYTVFGATMMYFMTPDKVLERENELLQEKLNTTEKTIQMMTIMNDSLTTETEKLNEIENILNRKR